MEMSQKGFDLLLTITVNLRHLPRNPTRPIINEPLLQSVKLKNYLGAKFKYFLKVYSDHHIQCGYQQLLDESKTIRKENEILRKKVLKSLLKKKSQGFSAHLSRFY